MFYRQNLTQFAIYRITFPGVSFSSPACCSGYLWNLYVGKKIIWWGKKMNSVSFFFSPNGWKLEGMRRQCHHSWLDNTLKRTDFLCEVQRAPHRAKRWIFLNLKWQNWVIKRVGYGDIPVLQHFAISYTVKHNCFYVQNCHQTFPDVVV